MKELSIVMAYHNRTDQLELTLRTIRRQYTDDMEIIVVDDASDDDCRAEPVIGRFDMDIRLVTISRNDKTWINPCIPYNIGFRQSTGRLIMIQNPECLHVGGVIQWARKWVTPNRYMTFSCYSSTQDEFRALRAILHNDCVNGSLDAAITGRLNTETTTNMRPVTQAEVWFNHPKLRPTRYHFCSCLTRDNLLDLGGFDERYADGYCWDDNEFLHRVIKKGLEAIIVGPEHGFVVHQWHEKGPLRGACPQWYANKWMFENVTTRSVGYKVGCL